MGKVAAVVVTFFPELQVRFHILRLISEFDRVFLVDNGSGNSLDALVALLPSSDKLDIHRFKENRGLGVALNVGVSRAAEANFDWVCCFDQDSMFISGSLDFYRQAILSHDKRVVGAGFPLSFWQKMPFFFNIKRSDAFHYCNTVITSGSFFSVNLWRSVGGFDEGYFIDSIDHDFCLKVHEIGGEVVRLNIKTLEHAIGVGTSALGVPIHNPVRKYYIFRNTLSMIRRYASQKPFWCLTQIFRLLVEFVSIVVAENEKKMKIKMAFRGIWDALRGVSGKYGS